MKKKTRIILLCFVIPALIAASFKYYHISKNNQTFNSVPEADWTEHYSDVDSLIKASDIVIKGKVVGSTTEQRADMIFTNQEIEVEKVYKGKIKIGGSIIILQTGGEMNNIKTQAFKEAPLLDTDGNYLLFLKNTDEGHYLILGGYQGVGKIENNTIKFNVESDEIAKELESKSFFSVDSILTNQTDNNTASD